MHSFLLCAAPNNFKAQSSASRDNRPLRGTAKPSKVPQFLPSSVNWPFGPNTRAYYDDFKIGDIVLVVFSVRVWEPKDSELSHIVFQLKKTMLLCLADGTPGESLCDRFIALTPPP